MRDETRTELIEFETDPSGGPAWDLPEHTGNPFVAGLGAPPTTGAIIELLRRTPTHSERERSYPHHLRRYCVLRLLEFVHPRACQLSLVERIGMAIRRGYHGRNPALGEHQAAILDAAERREAKVCDLPSRRVRTRPTGFAFVGQPGMGKSMTVELALEAYPKVLRPDLPYTVTQVPWLKMECPSRGGRKQFCISFFKALGERVGERYSEIFGRDRPGSDEMILHVQQLCQVHAVGILVIDEIQNLLTSTEGTRPLMNFLVALVNVIGVPVIVMGTMGATPVIEDGFSEARRAAGMGQPTWTRLRPGEEWDDLVADLWQYQWTVPPTPLDDEIRAVLYQECQGIIDVLVKLFMLAQFRAIMQGETLGSPELLTPELIASVAEEEFRVIRPMIHALRQGREDLLREWPDLSDFHDHFEAVVSRGADMTGDEFRKLREASARRDAEELASPGDPLNPCRAFLRGQGMASDVVEAAIARAVLRVPSRDPWLLMSELHKDLEGRPTPRTVRAKRARPSAGKARDGVPRVAEAAFEDDDLRGIAAGARARGESVHEGLVAAGVSKPVAEILAA
jgi:hypothetical protein